MQGTGHARSKSKKLKKLAPVWRFITKVHKSPAHCHLRPCDVVKEYFISSGTFGRIYGAKLRMHKQEVAVKKIPIMGHSVAKIIQEAHMLRLARHQNVVSILDVIDNIEHGEIWIITELLNSGSLRAYCTGDESMVFDEKLKVSCDCWSALAYLHTTAKITHKDIKPENILLHRPKSGIILAKLCDFGLATVLDSTTETQLTTITGTAMYYPPEYVEAVRNPEKADVYSMGASLCELFSQTYFWHHLVDQKPLSYPQIIAKLLTIWKYMTKGHIDESHHQPGLLKVTCCSTVHELLAASVRYERKLRPAGEKMRNDFHALWQSEMCITETRNKKTLDLHTKQ